jgi:hypothetical protein
MNPEYHLEVEKLQKAADRTIRLSVEDWNHLEICRDCLDSLAQAVRQASAAADNNKPAA